MRNPQVIRLLWIALFVEVGLGVLFLLGTRNISSFFVIFIILGFLGAIGYVARTSGMWTGEIDPGQNWGQSSANVSNWTSGGASSMNSRTTGNWNFGNISFNLGNFPERSEVLNQTVALSEETNNLNLNVYTGSITITGQEGLKEVQITATRRVWARDEMAVRAELDKLQLRQWQEGGTVRIEAGDPAQGFVIGRGSRIDLALVVPASLAVTVATGAGEVSCRQYHGEFNGRSTVGGISIDGYNSGRNITLNTTSGKIALQSTAAGNIRVKSGAGSIQLTGIGAEALELESTAGMIRARGVNCGRYYASATTGSVDLYDANADQGVELKTTAGRVHADNVTTKGLRLEATTGSIYYRGSAPTAPSEVISGVGSVQLIFPQGAAFNLEARSNVGSVDTLLPVSAVTFQSRNAFQGQIAGGGAPLRVTSQVGSIRVALG
ncbi:MAG TPA: DUF4097 family beta strand repeat-containing protein [Chloroflexia bacterium]|nr:DUF4097 family beta strand repeat-containing protein [Chloroflexia bacterium]